MTDLGEVVEAPALLPLRLREVLQSAYDVRPERQHEVGVVPVDLLAVEAEVPPAVAQVVPRVEELQLVVV